MFSWWNGSSGLQPNRQRQPRCSDFRKLEREVRKARHQNMRTTEFIKLHSSYEELEQCVRNGCTGCRVVRQALLLAQITGQQVQKLETRDDPVYVRFWEGQRIAARQSLQSTLQVNLGIPQDHMKPVSIALTTNIESLMLQDKRLDLVVPQIKAWLDNCCMNHEAQCGNLSWSKENPRRLIEIVSDTKLKLIDASQLPKIDYVALSYCWGDGGTYANTTSKNLASRQESFSTQSLPETIRDSLLLVRRLGLSYMWVDQVCIVQKSEDDNGEWGELETSKMHVVYGNALFTLSACSSEGSSDGLFRPRKAWTYPVIPFYFEGQWLINFDMTLKEVRARAPLSTRAWVLQEERLSPRLLYFCGQRVYWSCFKEQHMEIASGTAAQSNRLGRPFTHADDYEWLSQAQAFLSLRFEGNKNRLHQEWLDLVEAYCLRNMTQSTDRFRAISGLAAQYLSVYLTKDNEILGQEYLAGLWRATFAEDMAWSVDKACDPRMALTDLAPSWSWASLPLGTRIRAKQPFTPIDDFFLLEEPGTSSRRNDANLVPGAAVLEACRNGAEKKSVLMKGRLQQVMNKSSKQIDWSETQVDLGSQNGYSFAKYIDQHVHARNLKNGKIVIYEPNKRPMEGQLDYVEASYDGYSKSNKPELYVTAGMETDLYGLQIGDKTMLLLQLKSDADQYQRGGLANSKPGRSSIYRRVGIVRNVRDAFFDGTELVNLELE